MDGKRIRERMHVLFYLACILSLPWLFPACAHLPGTVMGEYYFQQADSRMKEGNYRAALEANQTILERLPHMLGDQALYRMGLIYIHPENENADEEKGLQTFQRIVNKYPSSALREKARLWVLILGKMHRREKDIREMNRQLAILTKDIGEKQGKIQGFNISQQKDGETIKNLRERIGSMELQIKNLKEQMEKLKKIDLGIEAKKRELKPLDKFPGKSAEDGRS